MAVSTHKYDRIFWISLPILFFGILGMQVYFERKRSSTAKTVARTLDWTKAKNRATRSTPSQAMA